MAEFTAPAEAIVLTHFIVASGVGRAPHGCSVIAHAHGPSNPGLVKSGPPGTGYGGTRPCPSGVQGE